MNTGSSLLREITWHDEGACGQGGQCQVGDMNFLLNHEDHTLRTTPEQVLLCKPRRLLCKYLDIFASFPHRHILEFGIFEGGSTLFAAMLLKKLEKIVAIDQRPVNPILDALVEHHRLHNKVKLYSAMGQDNPAIKDIVQTELNDHVDIIIDDCSHMYGPTRASFEMTFPLLAPGGLYIIEDWAWAHWPGYQEQYEPMYTEPALTNLIFEIIALRGTHQQWFGDIILKDASMIVIQKGYHPVPTPFEISTLTLMRGRTLSKI